jgi:uncharacterized protein (DUF2267 family)
MEYNEFLDQVQQQGNLQSRDEAEDAVRTTFNMLARRLPSSASGQLADQLPPELGRYFEQERYSETESFSLETFFKRVNEEEGLDTSTASQYVRAVMSTLRNALNQEQYTQLRTQLPEEFVSMFDTGGEQAVAQGS